MILGWLLLWGLGDGWDVFGMPERATEQYVVIVLCYRNHTKLCVKDAILIGGLVSSLCLGYTFVNLSLL